MRYAAFASLVLLLACGPSDTIDVIGPPDPGPAPSRPDGSRSGARPIESPEGSGAPADAAYPAPPPDAGAPAPDGAVLVGGADAPAPPPPPRDAGVDLRPPAPDLAPPDRAPDLSPPPPPRDAAPDNAPAACPPALPAGDLIDNFEDGNLSAPELGGRGGTTWTVLNDDEGATGALTAPTVPELCGSKRALRFAGTTSPTKVPIARLLLREGGGQFFNANDYDGIRLALRAGVPMRVRVKFPDRNTSSAGGLCQMCSDHWSVELEVGTSVKVFTILWTSLTQLGSGDPEESLDEANLGGIEVVSRNVAAFEIFIDDVSFVR